jgi:hypothetical protein
MRFKILTIVAIFISTMAGYAQVKSLDFALAAKNGVAPSFSFENKYNFGAKKRLSIAYGARANAYFGGATDYITAPALLTSGKRSLVAFFTEYKPDKLDTLRLSQTATFSLNSKLALAYNFKKSEIGFNIDLFGFTFGGKQTGVFQASESKSLNNLSVSAKPTLFNALLISDSDRGSLNSELYYKRYINEKSALRFGLSFQFVEYTTDQILTFENDRFRLKTLMPFVAYSFNPFKK